MHDNWPMGCNHSNILFGNYNQFAYRELVAYVLDDIFFLFVPTHKIACTSSFSEKHRNSHYLLKLTLTYYVCYVDSLILKLLTIWDS
jgi:hypothetical protein